jgi:hypothetical protein
MLLLVVSLGAALLPAQADEAQVDAAIDAGRGSAVTFRDAFAVLREAVSLADAATVASLANYPLPVIVDGNRRVLRSEAEFVSRYGAVMTDALAQRILTQDYGELRLDGEIVVFGEDELRMRPYCTDRSCTASYWLITAIDTAE